MLERGPKGKGYFSDLRTKPVYEQVNALRSRQERKGMNAAEYAAFESETFAKMDRVAEYFLASKESLEWAYINDLVLRAVLRVPTEVRRDRRAIGNFYEKLRKRAALTLANRKNSAMLDHQDRAGLDEVAKKLAENFESLESSVMQLVGLMEMRAAVDPSVSFATSVDLDVRYGVDLIEMSHQYDEAGNAIVADVRVYQAKANRIGMPDDKVRSEAARYEEKRVLIEQKEHLVLDKEWLIRVLGDAHKNELDPIELSQEELLDGLAEQRSTLARANKSKEASSPYARYAAQLNIWTQGEAASKYFECENSFLKPAVELGGLQMLYAFDTKKGLEILTPDQAKTYGQEVRPPSPPKGGVELDMAAK
jgi:hypothetical protein